MALAAALLPPAAGPPLSVRECDEKPWYADGADLAELVRRETELIGSGRVAVIAPPTRIAGAAAALGLAPGPDLGAPVAVLTPGQAKGLESDSAIIADPAGIEQASPRGRAAPPSGTPGQAPPCVRRIRSFLPNGRRFLPL